VVKNDYEMPILLAKTSKAITKWDWNSALRRERLTHDKIIQVTLEFRPSWRIIECL